MTQIGQDIVSEKNMHADNMLTAYLGEQINCMLLQYAASLEIKKNMGKGLSIIQSVDKIRVALEKTRLEIKSILSEQEIEASRERIGYYKQLFSEVSDPVLECNAKYFELPKRPQAAGYSCNEKLCAEDALLVAQDYFPELYEAA